MSNSGCSVKFVASDRGRFTAEQVAGAIGNATDVHQARTRLVNVENTSNRGGGSVWDINEVERIAALCASKGLALHMDGARIFNALVVSGDDPKRWGRAFHSISICLSKSLGAPIGSVLIGSKPFILEARRVRKRFGGGMRQAGIIAAAGLHAIDHHIARLPEDHDRAKRLEQALLALPWVHEVMPVMTNIVVFTLPSDAAVDALLAALRERGIAAIRFGACMVRMVTHLDVDDTAIDRVIDELQRLRT